MQGKFESNASLQVLELKKCAIRKNVNQGRDIHLKAIESGSFKDIRVATALITMYSRCSNMQEAHNVFKAMVHRNVVSWTALIMGYMENGESLLALEIFHKMDCAPDHVTLVSALKSCAKLATSNEIDKKDCLQEGLRIHKLAKALGLDKHLLVANTMLDVFCKCGDMIRAREMFNGMPDRDVVSWNILIFGYTENRENLAALDVFSSIDCPPNHLSFVAALKACAGLSEVHPFNKLQKGVAIHERATKLGFDKDVLVSNTLIDMYSKCADMRSGKRVFDRMKRRSVVSWTSLILGYVANGESLTALEVFNRMDCVPDRVTFVAASKACIDSSFSNEIRLKVGMSIEKQAAVLGFDSELIVGNTLLDMYRKCGDMSKARNVFDRMKKRDVVSWNTILSGYVENGESLLALDIFMCMDCLPDSLTLVAVLKACTTLAGKSAFEKDTYLQKGVSIHRIAREAGSDKDIFVGNTLVDMYCKYGDLHRAREVFDQLVEKDVVSWTALMLGYLENGESLLALEVFNNMNSAPDCVSFAGGLKACGSLGAIHIGRSIHARVCLAGVERDEMVATSLMDFYGKCGDMPAAEGVISCQQSPNTVSWTALMGGYSLHGDTSQVFRLVSIMEEAGVQLNEVTMQLVLTACSHAGLVERCQNYFQSMSTKFGIKPSMEHCACMVDTLGRANKLEEALSFVRGMPVPANSVVWTSLLGACRKWRNFEIGKVAFSSLIALDE